MPSSPSCPGLSSGLGSICYLAGPATIKIFFVLSEVLDIQSSHIHLFSFDPHSSEKSQDWLFFSWHFFLSLLKIFIYLLLRERGTEGERKGEKHQCVRDTLIVCLSHSPNRGTWPATQACALTGNRTCNPLVFRPELNPFPLVFLAEQADGVLSKHPGNFLGIRSTSGSLFLH